MKYQVKLHPQVSKFISKQQNDLSERIRNKLRLLEIEPFRYLERFEGQDFYKFRIGDYRALIDVDAERNIIFIRYLDHRKKIYKRNINKNKKTFKL